MSTAKELLEQYSQLPEDERIGFFDALTKESDKVLTERDKVFSQRVEEETRTIVKGQLYGSLSEKREQLNAMRLENKRLSQQLAELGQNLPNPQPVKEENAPMDEQTKSEFDAMKQALADMQERTQTAEKIAKEAKLAQLRAEVFVDIQVPVSARKFVTGDTEEALRASAAEVLATFNALHEDRLSQFKEENKFDDLLALRNAPPAATPAAPAAPLPGTPNPEGTIDALDGPVYDNLVTPNPAIGSSGQHSSFTQEQIASMDMAEYAANRDRILAESKARNLNPILSKF